MSIWDGLSLMWAGVVLYLTGRLCLSLVMEAHHRAKKNAAREAEFDAAMKRLFEEAMRNRQRQAAAQRKQSAEWCRVLGVAANATKAQINAAYRAKAMAAHPDKGGSTAAMTELNKARRDALASIN